MNLIRYLGADALSSERWVAPVLVFLTAVAVINASGGPVLGTYGASIVCLLPVGAWLTTVVVTSEDPVQSAITAATVGSDVRVRLAKLMAAAIGCCILAVVAAAAPLVLQSYSQPLPASQVAAGCAGLLFVAVAAVAAGSAGVGAIRRSGRAFLAALTLCLTDLLIAGAPPERSLLSLFDGDHPDHLASSLARIGVETAVLVAALVSVSVAVARRRA